MAMIVDFHTIHLLTKKYYTMMVSRGQRWRDGKPGKGDERGKKGRRGEKTWEIDRIFAENGLRPGGGCRIIRK
ncbi:hypothetical protein LJC20_04645 [Eubacteriales bacterium OttesenSCG-928-M02]|nr:hypothetical protein [Eubacteriales bacterium OttesenSCG-928-M02]